MRGCEIFDFSREDREGREEMREVLMLSCWSGSYFPLEAVGSKGQRYEFQCLFVLLSVDSLAANLHYLRVLCERNVFPDFAVGFALIG